MQETIRINDFTMPYARFGQGEKTLVLLPGLSIEKTTIQAKAIARIYAPVNKTHTVYLFDRRDDLPVGYDIHAMAEDTLAAMDALGIEKASVCGMSQGGMIALDMAVHHPETVSSLVLCGTCEYLNDSLRETLGLWAEVTGTGDSHALNTAFVQKLYSDKLLKESGAMLASVMPDYTEAKLRNFLVAIDSFEGYDLRAELGKIRCPSFVFGGAQDKVMGKDSAQQLAGLLGCEAYVYPEYGHAFYDEAKDFTERLAEVLEHLDN